MKNLKLFPKIFLYTLILMLLIAFFASGMIYLLAPTLVTVPMAETVLAYILLHPFWIRYTVPILFPRWTNRLVCDL